MRLALLPLLSHAWYGWREDETRIYAEIQVASMPFKSNFARLKDGRPKRVWIEVGAHAWENLQQLVKIRAPKDHINIRILPTMISAIPLILDPETRMWILRFR